MESCSLTNMGTFTLAAALPNLSRLEHVDVSRNNLSDAAATALVMAVLTHRSMKSLEVLLQEEDDDALEIEDLLKGLMARSSCTLT